MLGSEVIVFRFIKFPVDIRDTLFSEIQTVLSNLLRSKACVGYKEICWSFTVSGVWFFLSG